MDMKAILAAEIESYPTKTWTGKLGGQDVTLHARPISANDVAKVRKVSPDFPFSFDPVGMAEAIALKATDAEGQLVFDAHTVTILKRLRSGVVSDIFMTLFSDALETDEDVEENVGN